MNPSSVESPHSSPPVVVAGAFHTAIVLMRSFWSRGIEVHCVHWDRKQPAFRTIFGKAHLCPNPDQDPGDWARFMTELSVRIGRKPVFISSSDQYVTALADHADALQPHYYFNRSSTAVQGLFATKQRQYGLAEQNGLPVPSTRYVQSLEEARAFADTASFPMILKPLHFREWKFIQKKHPLFEKKLVVLEGRAELDRWYRLAAEINPAMVIQEMIAGDDSAKLVYLSCYASNGSRTGVCVVRQIRTDPIYFGSASVVEPVEDLEAENLCHRFLSRLHYTGICEIELKRDCRNGRLMMIEANPRYSITADAAVYAGVDIGWLHYLDLTGHQVDPVRSNSVFFRHITLFRDIATFRSYIRDGLLTWSEFFRSYAGPVHFLDFDLRDRRVAAGTVFLVIKLLFAVPLRRIFSSKRQTAAY